MQLHRYLQTITAWITARQRLVAFKGTIKTLDIFYLKNTPHITITHEDVKTFVDTYVQRLELAFDNYPAEYLAKAKAVLTERKLLSKNGNTSEEFAQLCQGQMTMHPESSLMALASAAIQVSEDSNPLKSQISDGVFPVSHSLRRRPPSEISPQRQGNIAIGVCRKCCASCDLLSRGFTALPSQDSCQGPVAFLVPGTHATVFPWLPPSFGIPLSILKDMRASLFLIFHKMLCTSVDIPTSDNNRDDIDVIDCRD